MGTKRKDLIAKTLQIRSLMGSMDNLISLVSDTDIHFEIGFMDAKGHSRCVYSSYSIKDVLHEYKENEYTEADGYRIDVWEGEEPAADISMSKKDDARVLFEISAVTSKGIGGDGKTAIECETLFRSDSALLCRAEWIKKGYTKAGHIIDIRESPSGAEYYHVVDFDIDSMSNPVPRMYGRDWLVSLIKNYSVGDGIKMQGVPEEMADRILTAYGRGKA